MNRITFLEIGGESFPLSFSLGLLKGIGNKFGGFNKIEEAMTNIDGELSEDSIDAISFLIFLMIKQGALYMNTFKTVQDVPDNLAKDEKGRVRELSQEQVEVGLAMSDIEEAMTSISKAMGSSAETEIEVESDSKNETATHQI